MHPVPAALIAYARFGVDIDGNVARHIVMCPTCAQMVEAERRSPESADEERLLESLAHHQEALRAAAVLWAKPR